MSKNDIPKHSIVLKQVSSGYQQCLIWFHDHRDLLTLAFSLALLVWAVGTAVAGPLPTPDPWT